MAATQKSGFSRNAAKRKDTGRGAVPRSRRAGPEAPATRTQEKGSATLGLLVLNPFGKFCQPGLDYVGGGSSQGIVRQSPYAAVRRLPAEGKPCRLVAGAGREMRQFLDIVKHLIDRRRKFCLPRRNLDLEKNAILVADSDARETPVMERSCESLSPVPNWLRFPRSNIVVSFASHALICRRASVFPMVAHVIR